MLKTIRESSDLADDTAEQLNAEIERFKSMFSGAEAA